LFAVAHTHTHTAQCLPSSIHRLFVVCASSIHPLSSTIHPLFTLYSSSQSITLFTDPLSCSLSNARFPGPMHCPMHCPVHYPIYCPIFCPIHCPIHSHLHCPFPALSTALFIVPFPAFAYSLPHSSLVAVPFTHIHCPIHCPSHCLVTAPITALVTALV
jgi:hypothetical protein